MDRAHPWMNPGIFFQLSRPHSVDRVAKYYVKSQQTALCRPGCKPVSHINSQQITLCRYGWKPMYHTILSRLPSVDRFANLFIMFHLSRLLSVDNTYKLVYHVSSQQTVLCR